MSSFRNGAAYLRLNAQQANKINAQVKKQRQDSTTLYRLRHHQENDNRGFWLVPEWQRRGFMTEACQAVNDFWFRTLGRPVMRVPKAALNSGSVSISLHS